jgi:hypothetical protein
MTQRRPDSGRVGPRKHGGHHGDQTIPELIFTVRIPPRWPWQAPSNRHVPRNKRHSDIALPDPAVDPSIALKRPPALRRLSRPV